MSQRPFGRVQGLAGRVACQRPEKHLAAVTLDGHRHQGPDVVAFRLRSQPHRV